MRLGVFCVGMFWCVTALASHSYGGLDLCKLYPEIMPPGMQPNALPQPQSRGAALLQTYCTQCHALPGPGRHTADEWQVVLDKMNLLMEVASRFGGLMGKVEVPDAGEKDVIRTYLTDNALQAMQGQPRGMGAAAFSTHCGSCHALPAAGQHSPEQWSAVLKRMQRNMTVMKYSQPSQETMVRIELYLQRNLQMDTDMNGTKLRQESASSSFRRRPESMNAPPMQIPDPGTGSGPAQALRRDDGYLRLNLVPFDTDIIRVAAEQASTTGTGKGGFTARDLLDSGRWLALGPLLLLLLVGLTRWWQGRTRP